MYSKFKQEKRNQKGKIMQTKCIFLIRIVVAHHFYLQVHHFLVQCCLRPLDLLNPLKGEK